MEKLIRDNVALRIKGKEPHAIRVAEPEEYPALLRAKLLEEVHEFIDEESVEELADVLEVIGALMSLYNIDPASLATMKQQKLNLAGGFRGRYVLEIK